MTDVSGSAAGDATRCAKTGIEGLVGTVVLVRYFEANGEVRQAISVVKKRGGAHERTIREFRLESGGIVVEGPLRNFRGVLTGVPVFNADPATARPAS